MNPVETQAREARPRAFHLRYACLFAAVVSLCPAVARSHEATKRSQPPWQQPTDWPDRIILTLPGDPGSSFAVTWRTDQTVPVAIAQVAEATSEFSL